MYPSLQFLPPALAAYPTATGASTLALFLLLLFLARQLTKRRQSKESHPYIHQFPPSRRQTLLGILPPGKTDSIKDLPPESLQSKQLPTTRAASLDKDDQYTPTGFSSQDIRSLGRFPDYASLSGVRLPVECPKEFDISKAEFRPFRPFRWGYHQTMSLMKLDPDYWVELEKNYFEALKARKALLEERGSQVFFHSPSSELACRELMEMVLQFVCKRYPSFFSLSADATVLHNHLLGTATELATTHPLTVLADNIPEDYAIMLRSEETGYYHLRAAVICSSVGWDIGMHRDKPLRLIHEHVPDYAARMEFSMDRFFARMPTDQPIQRCSWSLEDWQVLFSSPTDEPGWRRSAFHDRPGELTAEDVKLRCDWQTLRRLPLSGAVVFNFKAVFTPLAELRDEPHVPALLSTVLREGKENLITYKCVDDVKRVAQEALEAWAKEQVEKGVVEAGWEVGTLEDSPFFPGWEQKWRSQQGF